MLPKSLGGSRLSGKISGFIGSVLEFTWGCPIFTSPPSPLCASMFNSQKNKHIRTWTKSSNHVLGPVLVGDAAKKYENSTLGNNNKMCHKNLSLKLP